LTCQYLHKLCPKGGACDNYVCRAYFPDKQPLIEKNSLDVCKGDEYPSECLIYTEGTQYREEKKLKLYEKQCPFASNNRCDRPYEWWCKGSDIPFQLTEYQLNEKELPVRDEHGEVTFTRGIDDFKDTCLIGGPEIYMECPHYKDGVRAIEEYYEMRPNLKSNDKA